MTVSRQKKRKDQTRNNTKGRVNRSAKPVYFEDQIAESLFGWRAKYDGQLARRTEQCFDLMEYLCDTPPEQREGLEEFDEITPEPLPMNKVLGRVTRTFQKEVDLTIKTKWKSLKTHQIFEIRVTPEHPFFVPDENRYISINDIEVGTPCVSSSGYLVTLIEKEYIHERITVYNFEVENHHNYFVGNNAHENILVHNECIICDGSGIINQAKTWGNKGHSYGPPVIPPELSTITIDCFCNNLKLVTQEQLAAFNKSVGVVADGAMRNNEAFGGLAEVFQILWKVPFSRNTIVNTDSRWLTIPVLPKTEYDGFAIKFADTKRHAFASCSGEFDLLGAGGMGPCIGVVIFSKSAGMRAAFHFGPESCNETQTLKKYKWPPDSRAVIAGGVNEGGSNGQLSRTIHTLKSLGITLEGVSDTSGIYCDRNGNWVIPEGPGMLKP